MEGASKATDQLTEDDLLQALAARDGCAEREDWAGYARCLMKLEHIVKWVRSDNDQDPFERAHTLACEALEIFKREGDVPGQIDALCRSARFGSAERRATKLREAMALAEGFGDPNVLADVIRTLATTTALSDPASAVAHQLRALGLYERGGNTAGMAWCHFGLAVSSRDSSTVRRDHAARSAELFKNCGRLGDAAKSMSLALLYGQDCTEFAAQEKEALAGLALAQAAGRRSLEQGFYRNLARIYAGLGDVGRSRQYQGWHDDLEQSDGLTERERKRERRRQAKEFAALARAMGHPEAAEAFERS